MSSSNENSLPAHLLYRLSDFSKEKMESTPISLHQQSKHIFASSETFFKEVIHMLKNLGSLILPKTMGC
jgi:hypothetical protein